MRAKLKTPQGHDVYKMRKAIVEPGFGQIKEVRGFRRLMMRGLENARAEWNLICATQHLLKRFNHGTWQTA
jgi:hypothetical protein